MNDGDQSYQPSPTAQRNFILQAACPRDWGLNEIHAHSTPIANSANYNRKKRKKKAT